MELVRRRLAASRAEAQQAIAAGLVTVDGAPGLKPSTQVAPGQAVAVLAPPRRYVGRGGDKLAAALERFAIDPTGTRCLDAGVSTGGFTDCLLQAGAAHVLAVDVGYGQVHDRVRNHPRVEVRERTNVRSLTAADVGDPAPDLLVADLSFISLRTVLPTLLPLLAPEAAAIVLIKPQFEAGKARVGSGGVVRDPAVWADVLSDVTGALAELGWRAVALMPSPVLGAAGNVEFLALLRPGTAPDGTGVDIDEVIDEARRRSDVGGTG